MNRPAPILILLMILGHLELDAQLIQHLDTGNDESVLKDSTELIIGWNDLLGNSSAVSNMDFSLASPVTLGTTSGYARYFNGWVGEVKIFENFLSQDELNSERQKLMIKWVVDDYKTEAPTPDPASFSVPPKAISGSLVGMTASSGSDSHEPVEYYFTEITGNPGATNSGWQSCSSYKDGDLQALTQYALFRRNAKEINYFNPTIKDR